MKRLAGVLLGLALLLLLIPAGADALTLYLPNQSTIAWDPVTTFVGGAAIPAGDSVLYDVYLSQDGLTGEIINRVAACEATMTFPGQSIYFAGVRSVWIPAGSTQEVYSTVTWSNSTDVVAVPGGPFGWVTAIPGYPKGLKQKP